MTTSTKSETAAKKDVTKLQRAIVDGLEDVKAQDIQVFNTEHLSPLFERVIVASGTSNRQTKALAASVREAVKEAGFSKPRVEGEDNGEWIIVDCGPAVAHIMQPAIRQYYRLEELWGDTPVRLKLGAAKPEGAAQKKAPAKKAATEQAAVPARKPGKPKAAAAAPAAEAKPKAAAKKAPAKKAPAGKTSAGTAAAQKPAAKKAPVKTVVVKPAAKKPAAKKAAAKPVAKPAAKAVSKPAAKKAPVRAKKA
ncbi:MAG: ribosome silencing factor [Acidovorax sp.]|uniref:ribosome silencing factor n=1 Tax=Acidovorax sp. TaxID=1872122 RepID=UPI0025BF27B9|nr:ribosome silencing factor [Acidovorax sp.]MCE1192149.1 ribosome silencing factor [Acidovorax sp.]